MVLKFSLKYTLLRMYATGTEITTKYRDSGYLYMLGIKPAWYSSGFYWTCIYQTHKQKKAQLYSVTQQVQSCVLLPWPSYEELKALFSVLC